MTDPIQRAVSKAFSRVRLGFRSVLTKISSDTPIQLVQADAMAGEQLQDNELMQHYGLTSVPLTGTQMIVLPLGGKTAHGIIIATEHTRYRLKGLKGGEVAIYDDQGQQIVLTRNGIVIKGAGLPILIKDTPSVTAETPTFHITGNLQVDGNIANGGNVTTEGNNTTSGNVSAGGNISDLGGGHTNMASMREIFDAHRHDDSSTPDRTM